MNSLELMDQKELRKRIGSVYSAMSTRAKPKLWKTGKRKGQTRIPGLDHLPFTREQFWFWCLQQFAEASAIRCPYCVEIGRNATIISLANCVFDHKHPIKRAGNDFPLPKCWSLKNLVPVCADCNNLKGDASYDFFVASVSAVLKWDDERDKTYFFACIRTHGIVLQGFRGEKKKQGEPPPDDIPATGALPLRASTDW